MRVETLMAKCKTEELLDMWISVLLNSKPKELITMKQFDRLFNPKTKVKWN